MTTPLDSMSGTAHNLYMKRKIYLEPEVLTLLLERKGDRTQGELADEMGVTPKYVSDIITGKRSLLAPAVLTYLGLEKGAVESTRAA